MEDLILNFYNKNYKNVFPRSFQPEQFVKDNLNTSKAINYLKGLQSHVDLKKKKILEIGCGFGSFILTAQAEGFDCYAVDPDPVSLYLTRKRLQQNGFDHSVIVRGYGENLPFDNEFFDVVVSFHVLEHVNDPRLVLKECLRVLKPNGYFYIIVPNYNFLWEGHYGLIWFPRFPKAIAKIYVKLCGRSPDFLDSIRYITPYLLKSILKKYNVEIKDLSINRWNHNMDRLNFPSHNVTPRKILYITKKFKQIKFVKFIGRCGFYHEIELLVKKIG
jgi:SAM-dependent methyltransferase